MKFHKCLAFCLAALAIVPVAASSETYKESFECYFERGLVNRPTPARVVFSIDEFGRSALLHDVNVPKIDTLSESGQIRRDTPRVLSISWSGDKYVFSDSGRSYATNEARYDAVDMLDVVFSITMDRKTMKAIVKSKTSVAYASRDGFASGRCVAISAPKS
ncbi:hypothetical protein [uncultured Ruegeria sp.]|uniref:hypothetical protein n=1 Tax=uncultured Ruegeria sp. TaxID=259304 RepID=UPI0026375A5F|nr:hypothetical protein [uncultured Ruegeria sp.]